MWWGNGGCPPAAGQIVIQQQKICRVQIGAHEHHRLGHSTQGVVEVPRNTLEILQIVVLQLARTKLGC